MRTSYRPAARRLAAVLAVVLMWPGSAGPAWAQTSLRRVDRATSVRSLDFHFTGGQTFDAATLEAQIALRGRGGLAGLREALAVLPFVAAPSEPPFSPVALQKDVARLRRFYHRSGFPGAEVDYHVELDTARNAVDVHFQIREGTPQVVRALTFAGPGGEPAEALLAPPLHPAWTAFAVHATLRPGERVSETRLRALEGETQAWLQDAGYAFARVEALRRAEADTTADVRVVVDAGPRARVGRIEVEGNRRIGDEAVRRELPLSPGEWFSQEKLTAGQRQLFGLDLFRTVLVDVPAGQPRDTTVDVRVLVRESRPRLLQAHTGYFSDGAGVTGQAEWRHRNFFGAGRALSFSLLAETGAFSLADVPDRRYATSVSFRQPYVLDRRLEAVVAPFASYRDDDRDRSRAVGLRTTLTFAFDRLREERLRTLTLEHELSSRRILEYRFGDLAAGGFGILDLLELDAEGLLDSLGAHFQRSVFGLTGTLGTLDDLKRPRRGFVVQPTLEWTFPSVLTSAEYVRLSVRAVHYRPLGRRVGLVVRGTAGWLYPFGKSLPGDGEDAGLDAFLRLRDVLFTAGGTDDVRGWGKELLGSKFPDIDLDASTEEHFVSPRYVPIGDFTKLTASAELRLPFPGLGPAWGTFAFLDGGNVLSLDPRFDDEEEAPPDDPGPVDDEDPTLDDPVFYFSTGGGLSVATPVGEMRFAVGYKLNPGFLDLHGSQDVLDWLFEEKTLDELEPDWKRRFHLHLSLASAF